MPADLHCHTRLSDGSLGIEDLILLAQRSGVNTIAITDHDCQAGTVRGKIIGKRQGVNVIPGVELSAYDKEHDRQVHLLCYLADNPNRLEGLCRSNSLARRKASQLMIARVSKRFPISSDLVIKCAAGSTNIYKQHIMHALMECGYTTEIYGDLYKSLFSKDSPDSIFVQPKFPDPGTVLEAIHNANGVAVLAHPVYSKNVELIDDLIEKGLDGIEVWHPSHSEKESEMLLELAKEKDLLVTGGSNFQGMYGSSVRQLGSYTTSDEDVNRLINYQAKKRRARKKAEGAKKAEALKNIK